MTILDGIRATGKQKLRTQDSNGTEIEITLTFHPAVNRWIISISSGDFGLDNFTVHNSLNMLDQYQNLIEYGIACMVIDGGEPFLINDFSSQRALLAILTPSEVEEVNEYFQELKENEG